MPHCTGQGAMYRVVIELCNFRCDRIWRIVHVTDSLIDWLIHSLVTFQISISLLFENNPVTLSHCHIVTLSSCHPVSLSSCLPVILSSCLPIFLSSCLPVFLSSCLPVFLSSLKRKVFIFKKWEYLFVGASLREGGHYAKKKFNRKAFKIFLVFNHIAWNRIKYWIPLEKDREVI